MADRALVRYVDARPASDGTSDVLLVYDVLYVREGGGMDGLVIEVRYTFASDNIATVRARSKTAIVDAGAARGYTIGVNSVVGLGQLEAW